jgi:hypothetical protein
LRRMQADGRWDGAALASTAAGNHMVCMSMHAYRVLNISGAPADPLPPCTASAQGGHWFFVCPRCYLLLPGCFSCHGYGLVPTDSVCSCDMRVDDDGPPYAVACQDDSDGVEDEPAWCEDCDAPFDICPCQPNDVMPTSPAPAPAPEVVVTPPSTSTSALASGPPPPPPTLNRCVRQRTTARCPSWPGACIRPTCPCAASWNGEIGNFCCRTCRDGTACLRNYHAEPFVL